MRSIDSDTFSFIALQSPQADAKIRRPLLGIQALRRTDFKSLHRLHRDDGSDLDLPIINSGIRLR